MAGHERRRRPAWGNVGLYFSVLGKCCVFVFGLFVGSERFYWGDAKNKVGCYHTRRCRAFEGLKAKVKQPFREPLF